MITAIRSATARYAAPRAAATSPADRFTTSAGELRAPTRQEMLAATRPRFPQDWVGTWSGEMTVTGVPGTDRLKVQLDIQPQPESARYTWRIRYEGQPERPYELVPIQPEQGHWMVDEHNGILLDSYFEDGVLLSQFEVGKVRVTARYELEQDQINLEMTSFGRQPVRESAMGVRAFPLGSLQRRP